MRSEMEGLRPAYRIEKQTGGEWEYACRADSAKPFTMGDNIRPEQANYIGDYQYNLGNHSQESGKLCA
jgi:formylglycine-generating enzyme required for sulfatase activity